MLNIREGTGEAGKGVERGWGEVYTLSTEQSGEERGEGVTFPRPSPNHPTIPFITYVVIPTRSQPLCENGLSHYPTMF